MQDYCDPGTVPAMKIKERQTFIECEPIQKQKVSKGKGTKKAEGASKTVTTRLQAMCCRAGTHDIPYESILLTSEDLAKGAAEGSAASVDCSSAEAHTCVE